MRVDRSLYRFYLKNPQSNSFQKSQQELFINYKINAMFFIILWIVSIPKAIKNNIFILVEKWISLRFLKEFKIQKNRKLSKKRESLKKYKEMKRSEKYKKLSKDGFCFALAKNPQKLEVLFLQSQINLKIGYTIISVNIYILFPFYAKQQRIFLSLVFGLYAGKKALNSTLSFDFI